MKIESNIKRLFEAAKKDRGGVARWERDLSEAFANKEIRPDELRIRHLFEQLVPDGAARINEWGGDGTSGGYSRPVFESVGGTTTKAFQFITGQMVFTEVMEKWTSPEYKADKLVRTMPSSLQQETMPGVSTVGDVSEPIDELGEYPMATMSEEVVRMPLTQKRGLQVAISREMVQFDRTGKVLDRAREVAETLRLNKEKRILDVVLGIVNNYNYNETAYDTYQASSPWVNLKTSNALVDWTDIEAVEMLFAGMTDPMTGELVATLPTTLIVPPALYRTALNILRAHTVRTGSNSGNTQSYADGPFAGGEFEIVSGAYVKQRSASDSTWWFGDPKKAFVYIENDPITVLERPLGDESFSHDIVAGWKVFERGSCGVAQPRHMTKSTA